MMTDKERADLQAWLRNDAWREPLAFWNLLWKPAYPAGRAELGRVPQADGAGGTAGPRGRMR